MTGEVQDTAATTQRVRAIEESPALAAQAAELLRMPRSAMPLALDEARSVVARMRLVTFGKGSSLFREGDTSNSNHMLLVLEGEVSVDTGPSAVPDAVPIASIGPGSVLGEMALFDGSPRSASCTALSTVLAAGLSRQGLEKLIEEEPRVAAKLLVALSHTTAERLRAMGQQLRLYADLLDRLRDELETLRRLPPKRV